MKLLHEFCAVVCSHTRLITRNTISCIWLHLDCTRAQNCVFVCICEQQQFIVLKDTFFARVSLNTRFFFSALHQIFYLAFSLIHRKFYIQIYFLFQAHCKKCDLMCRGFIKSNTDTHNTKDSVSIVQWVYRININELYKNVKSFADRMRETDT